MTTIQDDAADALTFPIVLNLFDMTTIQDIFERQYLHLIVLNLFDMTTIQDYGTQLRLDNTSSKPV